MASDARERRAVDMAEYPTRAFERVGGSRYGGTRGDLTCSSPAVAGWFAQAFDRPTPAQRKGWPAIAAGGHTLQSSRRPVRARRLAAFLWAIDSAVL